MVHLAIPENHWFYYSHSNPLLDDFKRRLEMYKPFAYKINNGYMELKVASQFLAIFEDIEKFEYIKKLVTNLNVIRATSPLDKKSIWMEIFNKNVSKKQSCQWLCNHLLINQENTISFGNDFNDLDMLEWTNFSYAVENSHISLQQKFSLTKSHNESGFSEALQKYFV